MLYGRRGKRFRASLICSSRRVAIGQGEGARGRREVVCSRPKRKGTFERSETERERERKETEGLKRSSPVSVRTGVVISYRRKKELDRLSLTCESRTLSSCGCEYSTVRQQKAHMCPTSPGELLFDVGHSSNSLGRQRERERAFFTCICTFACFACLRVVRMHITFYLFVYLPVHISVGPSLSRLLHLPVRPTRLVLIFRGEAGSTGAATRSSVSRPGYH